MDGKTYSKPRTVKLDENEDLELSNYCKRFGMDVSTFIREAIDEKMNSGHISSVAGQNVIEFDGKRDRFSWKIRLDNDEEKTILEEISPEFMQNLFETIKSKITERNDLIRRKKKKSVAVPKRLVG
jgi:hypothetical protein